MPGRRLPASTAGRRSRQKRRRHHHRHARIARRIWLSSCTSRRGRATRGTPGFLTRALSGGHNRSRSRPSPNQLVTSHQTYATSIFNLPWPSRSSASWRFRLAAQQQPPRSRPAAARAAARQPGRHGSVGAGAQDGDARRHARAHRRPTPSSCSTATTSINGFRRRTSRRRNGRSPTAS